MSTATKEDEQVVVREVGEKVQLASLIEAGKTKDLGDGIVEAIVSTSSKDRHNEVILVEGIDLKPYKENPIVLYGHDYEALPIGKTLSIKKTPDGKLIAKVQFAVAEYPFANTVYQLVRGGYLNDVSIGGMVTQWSQDYMTIEKLEMVEFSVVNIGANRDAKIISRGLESIGKSAGDLKKEYHSFLSKQIIDKTKGMGDNELNETIKTLETLVGILKAGATEADNVASTSERRVKVLTLRKTATEINKTSEQAIKIIKLKGAKDHE